MVGDVHGVSGSVQVDPDTIFDLLSHQRRRIGLDYLRETAEPVSVSSLANRIAEKELEQEQSHVPMEYQKRVLGSLHHVHLPKMTEADVIEWDTATKVVTPTEQAASLYPHLQLVNI